MADVRSGLDPVDFRYINANPDPNFSPERNKAVIDQTIKETEEYFKTLAMARDNDLENRLDIISSYGIYRFNKGTKGLKDYLGKEQYEALIGENLLQKLRVAEASNKLIKNSKIQKGILL